MDLVDHCASDAWLSLGISFHLSVLPLTRQLSEVSGSMWTRALQVRIQPSLFTSCIRPSPCSACLSLSWCAMHLQSQRAQRIEMLLLHEFYARKFMLPDKMTQREREAVLKAARRRAFGSADDDTYGEALLTVIHELPAVSPGCKGAIVAGTTFVFCLQIGIHTSVLLIYMLI